jgi:trimeric autotransporter adhesin
VSGVNLVRTALDWATGAYRDETRSNTALTVGASPYTYTNAGKATRVVSVQGGTVTSIGLNQAQVLYGAGVTAGLFPLGPGDSITVTYTSAPNMRLITGLFA